MIRQAITKHFENVLKSARQLSLDANGAAVVVLAGQAFDFKEMAGLLPGCRLIVAADRQNVQQAAQEDQVVLVPILHEPQTSHLQVTQVLLEAIADDLIETGDVVVCVYSLYEKDGCDTVSLVRLADQLARLTSRDLQRLETNVPLETLRIVVDLACEIGREGREGKPVGTLFVVGNHRKVLQMSSEQVHDPFRGYPRAERLIRNPRVRESIKEIAQMDGAFVISADGVVQAAGRHLSATADNLTLSKGLGSRHWAAAEISKAAKSIAIAVSESTGTVRLFQDGVVVLRIEPMDSAMKWHDD
ncbi:MAG: DNA integrity scanning protein DisA nucleotide-binding domain protein [Planctomyces sp.]|jgi:DNA integrity scanning protein DisA with diadenylate cyclase activity